MAWRQGSGFQRLKAAKTCSCHGGRLKGQQVTVDHARWASLSCAVQEMEAERSSPSAGPAREPGRGSGTLDTESVLETVLSPLPREQLPGGPARGAEGPLGVASSRHPWPWSPFAGSPGESKKDFDNRLVRERKQRAPHIPGPVSSLPSRGGEHQLLKLG